MPFQYRFRNPVSLTWQSPPLLFVQKPVHHQLVRLGSWTCLDLPMLQLSNNTLTLETSRDSTHSSRREVWVCSEAFPIPATSCNSSQWSTHGQERHIDPFTTILFSQSNTISVHQVLVEGRSNGDLCWKAGDELLSSDSIWCICETQTLDFQSFDSWNPAHAWSCVAASVVDFLKKGHLGHDCPSFGVGSLPC